MPDEKDDKVISLSGWKTRRRAEIAQQDAETLKRSRDTLDAPDDFQIGVYCGPDAPGMVVLNIVQIDGETGEEDHTSLFIPADGAVSLGMNLLRAGRAARMASKIRRPPRKG